MRPQRLHPVRLAFSIAFGITVGALYLTMNGVDLAEGVQVLVDGLRASADSARR